MTHLTKRALQLLSLSSCCLLLSTQSALAWQDAQNAPEQPPAKSAPQIYKVVNEDGSVTYTDTPPPNADIVELDVKTRNVVSAMKVPKPQKSKITKKKPDYSVSITSPAPEATIRNNAGDFVIKAAQNSASKAPLYRLVFDVAPIQRNSSGIFKLEGINRGAHDYKVELTNNTGKTLASSPIQTLYLHQASVFINNN